MKPTPRELYEVFGFYDKSRFSSVGEGERYSYTIRCGHPAPLCLDAVLPEDHIPHPNDTALSISTVFFRRYVKGNREFEAGKCDICGKVYYR